LEINRATVLLGSIHLARQKWLVYQWASGPIKENRGMGSRARPMAARWQCRRRYGEPAARGGGGVDRGERR
jgi:hypothetical protein